MSEPLRWASAEDTRSLHVMAIPSLTGRHLRKLTSGREHSRYRTYHGGQNDCQPGFLFRPPIPAKNNRDLGKDHPIPANGHNDFIVWNNFVFFAVEQRIGGYERTEKREGKKEEWIALRHAVTRCAVLCYEHFLHIYEYTSAVRRL